MPATIHVHSLPKLTAPGSLVGSQAVIVDLLRASTTICAALHAGAACVRPVLEPQDAIALRAKLAPRECVLGGERKGMLIAGFDLGNSPRAYTPERVRGRDVVFTTTNGTRAIYAAAREGAARVLIGCFANLSSLVRALAFDGRDIHVLCAGTNGDMSMEDVLCAGAIVSRVLAAGSGAFVHAADDQSRIAQHVMEAAEASPTGVLDVMIASRGGRNLIDIGLQTDVEDCARNDWLPLVPGFDPATSTITRVA